MLSLCTVDDGQLTSKQIADLANEEGLEEAYSRLRSSRPMMMTVEAFHGQRGLDHDTCYVNHARTQRFLTAQTPRTSLLPTLPSIKAHYRQFRFFPERM